MSRYLRDAHTYIYKVDHKMQVIHTKMFPFLYTISAVIPFKNSSHRPIQRFFRGYKFYRFLFGFQLYEFFGVLRLKMYKNTY